MSDASKRLRDPPKPRVVPPPVPVPGTSPTPSSQPAKEQPIGKVGAEDIPINIQDRISLWRVCARESLKSTDLDRALIRHGVTFPPGVSSVALWGRTRLSWG
eukprot:15011060-Alexandrium_andersonii.AAC.1